MLAPFAVILCSIAAWLLWCAVAHVAVRNPKGDAVGGLAFVVNAVYVRLVQRLRVEGRANLLARRTRTDDGQPVEGWDGRGLIVVANHTAGVDPMLIQAACPFFIRWMMTSEMRVAMLDPLWAWMEIVFVSEDGKRTGASELAALREAVGYLKAGGAIGIFPEGRLERPKGVLHPFQPGMGLIVARSGARVLPIVIDGTPAGDSAWVSLFKPGRAVVRVMPVIDYSGVKAGAIVADLEARFAAWTGWRVVAPAPLPNAQATALTITPHAGSPRSDTLGA